METVRFDSWKSFRNSLFDYARQPRQRREQLVFRGHTNAVGNFKQPWIDSAVLDQMLIAIGQSSFFWTNFAEN